MNNNKRNKRKKISSERVLKCICRAIFFTLENILKAICRTIYKLIKTICKYPVEVLFSIFGIIIIVALFMVILVMVITDSPERFDAYAGTMLHLKKYISTFR